MSEGPSSLSEILAQAVALHQQGRLSEAEALYLDALRLNSKHFDALHLLGVIAQQQGRAEQARALIVQALALNPAVATAHSNLGLALQDLKRPLEALACYDRALALQPSFAEAHYNRGNALKEIGRLEEALASFAQALRLNPDYAEAWFNHGKALHEAKRLEEALGSYANALRLRPEDAEAHYSKGNALLDLNRLKAAVDSYGSAIGLRPGHADALNNRGLALHRLGRLEESLADYNEALKLSPDILITLINRTGVLLDLDRLEAALADCDHALRLCPGHADALNNRGNVLRALKQPEDALACFSQALHNRPGFAEAQNNRGLALQDLDRLDESLACYDDALLLKPDYANAFNSRGCVLLKLKRLDEALTSFDQALHSKPDYALALSNKGHVLQGLMRMDEALDSFNQALIVKPDFADAHLNESLARLALGDYERGWKKYEWRWETKPFISKNRNFAQPIWLGRESLQGKTILLHAEQGLGDTLQFCRYAKLVAAQGATVLLEVQPSLKSLLAGLEGTSQVLARGEPLPDFDCHCPLLSLPLAFQTRLDTIPIANSYLQADPARAAAWQIRLAEVSPPRIGFAWTGNPIHLNNSNRSIPLVGLLPLTRGPIRFISLHKELTEADRSVLEENPHIAFFGDELSDFSDTAALLENLDLVVTVDTSVAHLAAAMGKPTWVLLPFSPDWRWLLDRDDSPWYPTVKLFRQTSIGDWDGVIARVAEELEALLGSAQAPNPKANADDRFRQAFALHTQGQHLQAQTLYQAVLRDTPNHFDALHLLGISALETGDTLRGLDLIRQAIRINPNQAAAHANLGTALRKLSQPEEALACFTQALKLQPDDTDCLNSAGIILEQLQRPEEALTRYREALRIKPDYVDALINSGNALQSLGRREQALAAYDHALRLRPQDADAHNNRGNVLCAMKRPQEALESYEHALRLRPDYVEALSNRGNALLALNRIEDALACYEQAVKAAPGNPISVNNHGSALLGLKRLAEALACFDEALRLKPDYIEALNNRGAALHELKRPEEALACFTQALRLQPNYALASYNCGMSLHALKRYDEALSYYRRAMEIQPDYAEAFNNCGVTLLHLGHLDEALAHYAQALRIKDDYAQAHFNQSLTWLVLGDLERGLPEYEWRWETEGFMPRKRGFGPPLWLGRESLQGKTILLHAEQGFGDTIQFCRYAKLVAALGAKVVLEIQPALKTLLADLEGTNQVLARGEPLPYFDYHCPLLSLPLALQTRLDTIPAARAYLKADSARAAAWQARLGNGNLPRIGLAWSGNPNNDNDSNRSIPLACFRGLISRPGHFVSLQKELREADRSLLEANHSIAFFGEQLGDYSDTAALIENLDLVITVDTSVAHLAAALGKPVWLLLPFYPDWRWLLGRNDSPWYPTVRLFRQSVRRDWGAVMEGIAKELDTFLAPGPVTPGESFRLALDLQRQGRHTEARALYQSLLRTEPERFDILHMLGISMLETGEMERGVELIRRAINLDPNQAAAHTNLGAALRILNQPEEALTCFAQALRLQPDDADAFNNQGNALRDLKRPQEALASYENALRLRPDYVEAHNNRGNALQDLERWEEALADFDRALQLRPAYADAYVNRGNLLRERGRTAEALADYAQALQIKPGSVEAFYNQGLLLSELGRHEEAAISYAQALNIVPDYPDTPGLKLNAQLLCCDWTDYAADRDRIIQAVRAGKRVQPPFEFLAVSASEEDQRRCAQIYFANRFGGPLPTLCPGQAYNHRKIRLAYLSPDFREHAVAFLLIGLLESHDKERFELTGISLEPGGTSEIRTRLERAFDRLVDVKDLSDREIAQRLRDWEIDIAIDLSGYTTHSRTGILMHRPAPLQVSYLGYPGTMGAGHIDYILADPCVIPEHQQKFYAEKVVYLPDTYWVSDPKLILPDQTPTKTDAGLPEQGFVFCCFNNHYKITPECFAVWMRLLRQVDGSVLWMLGRGDASVTANLRKEAARFGIAPERLVFAPHAPKREEHLTRQRLADLFLDTLPYNAHATASDALRVGLPVLSCQGSTFAGRVASSLLQAIGLPELITHSLEDYEALALKLATTPDLLAGIKLKLAENRNTHPLFDTDRFRRHIESAYLTMMERHRRGEPPEGFAVEPVQQ